MTSRAPKQRPRQQRSQVPLAAEEQTLAPMPNMSAHEATTPARRKRLARIGFHAPIAGGLQNALLKSHGLGCDTMQIFSRNPRGWSARPLGEEEVENFKRVRAETRIDPVVIHANYLINLAAADATIREKSIASFREEIERGVAL
ncbi:MAG: deoxyribonuclease, partial [Acidobacteriota bacterium]|nr:deoxyribonuclease [Acidobacteriota bacterium]